MKKFLKNIGKWVLSAGIVATLLGGVMWLSINMSEYIALGIVVLSSVCLTVLIRVAMK